jgi:hypothetical protein
MLALALSTPAVASAGEAPDLGLLRAQYRSIQTVHARYSVKIWVKAARSLDLPKSGPISTTGSFEFWSDGTRYRSSCHTDPRLGLMADVDYAFDGNRFSMFDPVHKVLSVQRENPVYVVSALPNPLLLPAYFLEPENDACIGCALTWAALRGDDVWKAARLKPVDDPKELELRRQAGTWDGIPFLYRAQFAKSREGTVPGRIERTTASGVLMALIELSDYGFAGEGQMPYRITVTDYDFENPPAGDPWLSKGPETGRFEFSLDAFEVNGPLDPAAFSIPEANAAVVWDSDAHAMTKAEKARP